MLEKPSADHLLGTTEVGADVFSQLLVGARVSIVVGFAAALISAVLGSAVGLIGGYFGGWTDRVFDSFENWFLVIPHAAADGRARAPARPVAERADHRHRRSRAGRARAGSCARRC